MVCYSPLMRAALVLLLHGICVADAFHRELFTTNAICKQNNCINPVFPGVEDLGKMESSKWACSTKSKVRAAMVFCKEAIDYNAALPQIPGAKVPALVKAQEKAAITAYAYHLQGMGLEAWDHTRPAEEADPCIKSIWKMACFTYFPKADFSCKEGQETPYLRPCRSSCSNYVKACAVECCDESVQCVFQHEKPINKTAVVKTSGYAPYDGPSPYCTGAAVRTQLLSKWLILLVLVLHGLLGSVSIPVNFGFKRMTHIGLLGMLVIVAISMQGCDMDSRLDVPAHKVGNWRLEPDYLISFEFVPPGSPSSGAQLNSCEAEVLPTVQCSGRGTCKAWDPDSLDTPVSFCECNRDWADPECRTRRKSQTYAYLLSLFGGWVGADWFYLGYPGSGAFKAVTLGGFGIWWLYDVIRVGSSPTYAYPYRVAADLPHWAFVLSLMTFMLVLSFTAVGYYALVQRAQRRKDALLLQAEEYARRYQEEVNPYGTFKQYAVGAPAGISRQLSEESSKTM